MSPGPFFDLVALLAPSAPNFADFVLPGRYAKKTKKNGPSKIGTRKLSQWVPVPPLVALWQLLVLKNIVFGMILGPFWLLWAVSGFIHL